VKLSLVGAGLRCEHLNEIALRHIRDRREVYVDVYTSLYQGGLLNCILKYREDAKEARRKDLEGDFLKDKDDVALVVAGDPLAATTHVAIYLDAVKRGYDVYLVPGISALQVARTKSGLSQYRFGRTVTMMYPREGINFAESVYHAIKDNDSLNLHTIVLLETGYDRSMSAPEAAQLLLEETRRKGEAWESRKVIAMAKLCWDDERIVVTTLEELTKLNLGEPPHLVVVPSPRLHPVEEEFLDTLINGLS